MFNIINKNRIDKKRPKLHDFLIRFKNINKKERLSLVNKIKDLYNKKVENEYEDLRFHRLMDGFDRLSKC